MKRLLTIVEKRSISDVCGRPGYAFGDSTLFTTSNLMQIQHFLNTNLESPNKIYKIHMKH